MNELLSNAVNKLDQDQLLRGIELLKSLHNAYPQHPGVLRWIADLRKAATNQRHVQMGLPQSALETHISKQTFALLEDNWQQIFNYYKDMHSRQDKSPA